MSPGKSASVRRSGCAWHSIDENSPTRVSSYDWPEAAGSGSERKTPSENAPQSSAFKGVSHPLRSERESNIFRSLGGPSCGTNEA
jgi:hypothetical protein